MLVVNINRKHSYNGSLDLVAARFLISYSKVRELLGQDQVLFWCNSTTDHNEVYHEMRRLIVRILNQSMGDPRKNKLYMRSMYYQLLHRLTENFLLTENNLQEEMQKNKDDAQIQEIFAYIRTNFRQNIMLEDIAGHLYLSPIYVSKYIKQQCGITFMELLNTVRLNRAMEDLMYTDDSIMKIALENGFASVSAYGEMEEFYQGIISNFVNRYGSAEVSGWYFEFWEDTNVHYPTLESYTYTAMAEEGHKQYFHAFSIIAGVFRRYLSQVKIGGGGFPVRLYGENGFAQILTVWKQEKEYPDFISLSCYPYIQEKEGEAYYEKRNTDMEFVRHNLEMARNAMKKADFPEVELHVSEYSLSLSNRNIINDSCMKGAFMVHNAISCLGKADMMGHWLFTDAYADSQDSGMLLFGGCGLLTKDGITKPAYYAIEFLNRLYRQILRIHPNYLITRSERGSIRMICHNMKKLNYYYYVTEEDSLQMKDIPMVMENREFLTLHFRFAQLKDGKYTIKQNRLNRSCGSVQDNWEKLNRESDLTMREMEYLKNISTSAITIREEEAKQGILEFDISMEPDEIQYIHLLMKG